MDDIIKAGRRLLHANWETLEPAGNDQKKGLPYPPQEDPVPEGARVVKLVPAGDLSLGAGRLIDAMAGRKSRRAFEDGPLTLEELSFLCWAAEGVRELKPKVSFRVVPSGGARHPLDLYVFAARVSGVEPGLYRYLPIEHALVLERAGDDSERLDAALRGQYWKAAAVFIWAAVPYRSEWRYSVVAAKLVALDAGHSCQNLYLAAEGIGCGTCAIGAYAQEKLDAYLGLDGEERFAIYAAPVGKRRADA
jgi:SagB-type dehydrogenase family enzyme